MSTLTDEQRAAVRRPGNVLLEACPGSGKTTTLVAKLVEAIESVRGTPRRLCCITYTNTAAYEIEERALAQLNYGDGDYLFVGTIHAFCLNEILRPFAWMLPGYQGSIRILTRDSPDFEKIATSAAGEVGLFNLTHGDFEAFESLAVDSGGQIVGTAGRNAPVSRAAPYFWRRAAAAGYYDFGTIVSSSFQLLGDPRIVGSLAAKYSWFLIDEIQDSPELQLALFRRIYDVGRSSFFAVGDPLQSIYAFTGAKPELLAPFARHIRAATDLSLTANFRSAGGIVAHAERLCPRVPPMVAGGPLAADRSVPTVVLNKTALNSIVEDFLPALADRRIPLGKASVLAKDWASLIVVARGLREFQVPIVGPGARPYRRSRLFATLAEQLCGAVLEPTSDTASQLGRALYQSIRDATGESRPEVFAHEGRVTVIRLLRAAQKLAEAGGAVQWLRSMSLVTEEILTKANFLGGHQIGLFPASVEEMLADMRRQKVDLNNLTIDALGLFASPTKALRLSTIHHAKGREFTGVAVIGLREGAFPHYKADDVNAERRLFYVAITRAERFLLYVADRDQWGNAPSRFLGLGGIDALPRDRSQGQLL